MSVYVYIYVGEKAGANFRLGMDSLTWGWKQPAQGQLAQAATTHLQNPGPDTYLVFAQEVVPETTPVGWPRTPEGDMSVWQTATITTLTLARVNGPMYTATSPLWPDDTYPHRVAFDSITQLSDVAATSIRPTSLVAVRHSVLRQGRPILGPAPLTDDAEAAITPTAEDATQLPDRLLDGTDGLNGLALTLMRREQQAMRNMKFGTKTLITCALCGRELPVGIVRLAHIKRRAEASDLERLNPDNTMAACTLGCDELFERGYLTVDHTGAVELSTTVGAHVDLNNFATPLAMRQIGDYTPNKARFFAWHRSLHRASS